MDSPDLIDAFRSAAVNVTSLFRAATAAQKQAHVDGYQECLRDLVGFLDSEDLGLRDGEGWKIRAWAMDKINGNPDAMVQDRESEDEIDKAETSSSPELARATSTVAPSTSRGDQTPREGLVSRTERMDSAPPSLSTKEAGQATSSAAAHTANSTAPLGATVTTPAASVPTQEAFTFQSSIPYPEPNLERLQISESPSSQHPTPTVVPHAIRTPRSKHANRASLRSVGKAVAGQKRKLNLTELFNLDSLGAGKDFFDRGREKRRHIG
jgi:hypothetical protein